jgi:hypothetical protein
MRRPSQLAKGLEEVEGKIRVKKPKPQIDVPGVVAAAATMLGLTPDLSSHLEEHLASRLNSHLPYTTCISCGVKCSREKEMMFFDPLKAVEGLSAINPKIGLALRIIERRRRGSEGQVSRKGAYNGFCSDCMRAVGKSLPSAFRIDIDNEAASALREMVVQIVRLGLESEAVFVLKEYLNEFQGFRGLASPDRVPALGE